MQQTTQYRLNKPEADDPIAVAPLNENADKIEAALLAEAQAQAAAHQAEAQARTAADTALAQRVTALEAKHIVMLTYTGNGAQDRVISLGFTPTGGVYLNAFNNYVSILTPADTPGLTPAIVSGGVLVPNSQPNFQYNASGKQYRMILFN